MTTKPDPFTIVRWLDELKRTAAERIVLLHMWRRGDICWESTRAMAINCHLGKSTISRSIKALLADRYILETVKHGRFGYKLNYEIINEVCPTEGQTQQSKRPTVGQSVPERGEVSRTGAERPTVGHINNSLNNKRNNNVNDREGGRRFPAPQTDREIAIISHPAVDVYFNVINENGWPGWEFLEIIIPILTDTPSEKALTKAWQMWIVAGYKRSNKLGVLEWYKNILDDPDWTRNKQYRNGRNGHSDPSHETALQKIIRETS